MLRTQPILAAMSLDKLLRDIMRGPDPAALAAREAARTDPWRWYCRLCGASGESDGRAERDQAALAHLNSTPCGDHRFPGRAWAGRLLHVWSYGD